VVFSYYQSLPSVSLFVSTLLHALFGTRNFVLPSQSITRRSELKEVMEKETGNGEYLQLLLSLSASSTPVQ